MCVNLVDIVQRGKQADARTSQRSLRQSKTSGTLLTHPTLSIYRHYWQL